MISKEAFWRTLQVFAITLVVGTIMLMMILQPLSLPRNFCWPVFVVAAMVAIGALVRLMKHGIASARCVTELWNLSKRVEAPYAYEWILQPLAKALDEANDKVIAHQQGTASVLTAWDPEEVVRTQGKEGLISLATTERQRLGKRLEAQRLAAKEAFWSMHTVLAGLPHLKGPFAGDGQPYKDYLLPFQVFMTKRATQGKVGGTTTT